MFESCYGFEKVVAEFGTGLAEFMALGCLEVGQGPGSMRSRARWPNGCTAEHNLGWRWWKAGDPEHKRWARTENNTEENWQVKTGPVINRLVLALYSSFCCLRENICKWNQLYCEISFISTQENCQGRPMYLRESVWGIGSSFNEQLWDAGWQLSPLIW